MKLYNKQSQTQFNQCSNSTTQRKHPHTETFTKDWQIGRKRVTPNEPRQEMMLGATANHVDQRAGNRHDRHGNLEYDAKILSTEWT